MRKLTRFVLNILGSLGGGPLSIGGELPGVPQVARQPKWLQMNSKDFQEADRLNAAQEAARNENDWKVIFHILDKCLDSSPRGALLAVVLNNLAVAAYRAGRKDLAKTCIERAKKVPVSLLEVTSCIDHNVSLMGETSA